MTTYKRLPIILIGTLLLTLSSSSAIASNSSFDLAFEQMLRGIDTVPTRQAMEKRWPDIVERLVSAGNETNRDNYTRSRAISLLSFFADDNKVRPSLEKLLEDKKTRIRGIAVYTLARTFGDPGDKRLVDTIEVSVRDNAREVRNHAVRSLRWVRHTNAVQTLKRIAKQAPEKTLRTLATRTLEKRRF